jgi:hypothetical protein
MCIQIFRGIFMHFRNTNNNHTTYASGIKNHGPQPSCMVQERLKGVFFEEENKEQVRRGRTPNTFCKIKQR